MVVKEKISVRGTSHHRSSIAAYNLGHLTPDAELFLKAEPTNPKDKNAIEIFLKNPPFKLGYVPRELALKYSRLLSGKRIQKAVISSAGLDGNYLAITAVIWYRYVNDIVKNSIFWTSALEMPYSAGVYAIVNVATDRRYIGSSKNIRTRIFSHILDLSFGVHTNVPLASDYKIYGPDGFEAQLIDKTLIDDIKTIEAKTIDNLFRQNHSLYNMTRDGEPPPEGPHGGSLPISDWTDVWSNIEILDNDLTDSTSNSKTRIALGQERPDPFTPKMSSGIDAQNESGSHQIATSSSNKPIPYHDSLKTTSDQVLYKQFPFLDMKHPNANIDAIIAVIQRKVDLELKGLPHNQALAKAINEIGPKYISKSSSTTPTIKRW